MNMNKIVLILSLVFFSASGAFAMQLEGGVKYNVDSAREYVQQNQVNNIAIQGHATFDDNDSSIAKKVYSYNNSGDVVGVTVQYKNESNAAYIFVNNRLKYVDKYDRNVDWYPHRGYRYNLAGELVLTSLTVSKSELFRFTPSGELLVHSVNGVMYDESGNVIGTASK